MARRRHERHLLEAERAEVAGKQVRHLRDAAVLRAHRWLPHPALQLRDVLRQVRVDVR